MRSRLVQRGWKSADQLAQPQDGATAWACGIVTLEDETGSVNIIVWRHVRERQRTALLRSHLLAVAVAGAVAGQWQAKDGSTHLIARRLVDVTPWLGALTTSSRDFH